MNEGYQDREDPGLTVRCPLVDRPGESLLVWTTTPWTLTANVAAAVGPDAALRQGPAGRPTICWVGRERLKQALVGPVRGPRGAPRLGARRLALRGPVRRPAGRRARVRARQRRTSIAWSPWDEVGEDEGTGIVHIAPGCGAEDFQLGKALGLPVSRRSTRTAATTTGFGWLSRLEAPAVAEPIVDDLERHGLLLPPRGRTRTATRTAGAAGRRCSSGSSTSGSSPWARSTTGRATSSPPRRWTRSLRYQIMEVVDQIRWIPGFGYERELDWLLNMHDWMISKKRYWGLALPIYDCPACGTFDVIGGRDELEERAVDGWATFEGHTPHRPYVDAVTIACPGCGDAGPAHPRRRQPVARRRHRAVLDAPLPRGPGRTGRSGSRPTSSPRASPASSATGSTRCSRCRPCSAASRRSGRSSATRSSSARTAGRCTRAGATRSSSTRPPSGWASTSCAGCSPGPGPTTTSSSAGTPPTRRAASCSSCGTSTRSS